MKWGVRRYQNADGTLTAEGRKRYGVDTIQEYKAKHKTKKTKSKAVSKNNTERKKSSSKDDNQTLIQKHKNNLIQKYMEKGYSRSAAEVAAKQRMKTELIIGSIAAVSVALIARKAITRIGQDYCDKVIKSGKVLQNIGARGDVDFGDTPFFAAISRHDKRAYRMLYPNEKRNMVIFGPNGSVRNFKGIFKNDIKVTKDVKRASVNNARKILYEKMNTDPTFKKDVFDTIKKTFYGHDVDANVFKNNPKKFYDRFNQALATPEFQSKGIHKQFYSALEKKGYNAILDINDTRYSGYKKISKSPTIFFGKDFVNKVGSTKLDDDVITSNANKYLGETVVKGLAKATAGYTAVGVAAKTTSDTKKINKYLDEHPNSKLSRKEILDAIKQEKKKRK